MIFIGIPTANKRDVGNLCLQRTVQSLLQSGFEDAYVKFSFSKIHIFDSQSHLNLENETYLKHDLIRNYPTEKKYTLFENNNRVMDTGREQADWVLLLQDDIIVTQHFFHAVYYSTLMAKEKCGLIAFFHPYVDHIKPTDYGLFWFPPEVYWGSQALLFRASFINTYFQSDFIVNRNDYPHPEKFHDFMIQKYLLTQSCPFHLYGYFPPLVQHIGGQHSTVDHRDDRRAVYFPGETFDAMKTVSLQNL
jgi:hypothetical protein